MILWWYCEYSESKNLFLVLFLFILPLVLLCHWWLYLLWLIESIVDLICNVNLKWTSSLCVTTPSPPLLLVFVQARSSSCRFKKIWQVWPPLLGSFWCFDIISISQSLLFMSHLYILFVLCLSKKRGEVTGLLKPLLCFLSLWTKNGYNCFFTVISLRKL